MAAICLIVATGAGCRPDAGDEDRKNDTTGSLVPGLTGDFVDNHAGVSGPLAVGRTSSFTGLDLCVRTTAATITTLAFTSSGAEIVDAKVFVRYRSGGTSGLPALDAGGTVAVGAVIDRRCRPGGDLRAQQLDVLLRRTSSEEVTGKLEIGYTSDARPLASSIRSPSSYEVHKNWCGQVAGWDLVVEGVGGGPRGW